MDNEFDIVVYGATGFTGQLIFEYLVQNYADSIKLALAGRNESKLKAVRDACDCSDRTPIILANSDDPESLLAMARRTRLVISCTGPFTLYGSNVVRACTETGTDYVDVTGEVYWTGQMIEQYATQACQTGARIVFCCGFDSVPSDLGVYYLQKLAKEELGHPINRVKGRVESLHGAPGGGSAATQKTLAAEIDSNPGVLKFMNNPHALTPEGSGPKQPGGMEPQFDEELNSWAAPFIMSTVNSKVVHRSNALLGHVYGTDFVYDEMTATGPGEEGKAQIAEAIRTQSGFTRDGPDLSIQPGEGPGKAVREAGHYALSYNGIIDGKVAIKVTVSDDLDPGFGSTARLVAESALCLLQDNIEVAGGMWTPASAMAEQLLKRLPEKGVLSIRHEMNLS